MYKKLPKNVRSLNLKVKPSVFKEEWIKCASDKKSNLTSLLKIMDPVFDNWVAQLTNKDISDDINFITLCQLISPNPSEALQMIKKWVEIIEETSSLKDEICYIFIERIRKIRYIPTLANAKMIEYIVAKDLKHGIYHHIRYTLRLSERDAWYNVVDLPDFDIGVEYIMTDCLLMDNLKLKLTNWQSYLFHMISEGYSSVKRSTMTKIHRRNLYKEEKIIWDSLKQML